MLVTPRPLCSPTTPALTSEKEASSRRSKGPGHYPGGMEKSAPQGRGEPELLQTAAPAVLAAGFGENSSRFVFRRPRWEYRLFHLPDESLPKPASSSVKQEEQHTLPRPVMTLKRGMYIKGKCQAQSLVHRHPLIHAPWAVLPAEFVKQLKTSHRLSLDPSPNPGRRCPGGVPKGAGDGKFTAAGPWTEVSFLKGPSSGNL